MIIVWFYVCWVIIYLNVMICKDCKFLLKGAFCESWKILFLSDSAHDILQWIKAKTTGGLGFLQRNMATHTYTLYSMTRFICAQQVFYPSLIPKPEVGILGSRNEFAIQISLFVTCFTSVLATVFVKILHFW